MTVFHVTLLASVQPSRATSDSLTPTTIGDSMIFSCSLTLACPCGSDNKYFALANHATSAFVLPVSTCSVLSIVPPNVNFSVTPVALSTIASSGEMSRRSVVARMASVPSVLTFSATATLGAGMGTGSGALPQALSSAAPAMAKASVAQ